jgi:CheY-like chemotaxis protein
MKPLLRVLHLEDNLNDAELVQATLTREGIECEVVCVETRDAFLAALEQGGFDLILADYTLPSFDGMSALTIANEKYPDIPFIFVSGSIGEERAIEALKNGATDYVLKDRLFRLGHVVRRALQEFEERSKRKQAEEAIAYERSLLRTLIDNLPDHIYFKDAEHRLILCNNAVAENLGMTNLEDILGKTDFDLFPRELAEQYYADEEAIMKSGLPLIIPEAIENGH